MDVKRRVVSFSFSSRKCLRNAAADNLNTSAWALTLEEKH